MYTLDRKFFSLIIQVTGLMSGHLNLGLKQNIIGQTSDELWCVMTYDNLPYGNFVLHLSLAVSIIKQREVLPTSVLEDD